VKQQFFAGAPANLGACGRRRRSGSLTFQDCIIAMAFFRSKAPPAPTIFVVDDEVLLLELAAAILAPLGCKVLTFSDPEQALKAFAAAAPAVVLTDYAMGRMSGMDLIRECRKLNPQQKTILISGTVDGAVFADAPVRPDLFVAKPYDVNQLVETVRTMIQS
jgi:DNA-binding NtrC family response regulator